jgi:Ca2+/H+ antiporter, TMEM165/GDT1 family
MLQDFLIPFIAVGLAELGDKTQIAVFCLSSNTKKYFRLLLGVMLAFAIADGLAILLGDVITRFVPIVYIKIIAGIIFLAFGIITLLNRDDEKVSCEMKTPFLSGFGVIFLSEMGDKTQIASALFAAEYNPWLVFLGVMLALSILSIMAVYIGRLLLKNVKKEKISIVSGVLFVIIGLWTLISIVF